MIDHEQWANVVAMLTGHEPAEVEVAYRKVKATKPPAPLPEAYPEGAAVAIGTVPEEPHVIWRGSASDFATDVRATLPPDKLDDLVRLLSGPSNRHR